VGDAITRRSNGWHFQGRVTPSSGPKNGAVAELDRKFKGFGQIFGKYNS